MADNNIAKAIAYIRLVVFPIALESFQQKD
jgi:hypothetical protein